MTYRRPLFLRPRTGFLLRAFVLALDAAFFTWPTLPSFLACAAALLDSNRTEINVIRLVFQSRYITQTKNSPAATNMKTQNQANHFIFSNSTKEDKADPWFDSNSDFPRLLYPKFDLIIREDLQNRVGHSPEQLNKLRTKQMPTHCSLPEVTPFVRVKDRKRDRWTKIARRENFRWRETVGKVRKSFYVSFL